MNEIRQAMAAAARATGDILASPEIADRWSEPSALQGFTIGGLAAHVTTVLASCHRCMDDPDTTDEPLPPEAYYTTFTLTEPGSDANATVVAHGEERAAHGPDKTRARFDELLGSLEERLETEPEGRVAQIFGALPMRLDDFFLTRALEFAVHSDDLAVSIGAPTPEIAPPCLDLVLGHMVSVARHRHGDLSVLRAFTRRERDEVQALRVL